MNVSEEVTAYIARESGERRKMLGNIRQIFRDALPGTEEKMAWGMPTYRGKHNIIHFASNKNHIGIYPGPETIEHFSEEFDKRGYHHSKGAVQIPWKEPLPKELLREMALYSRELTDEGNQ